MALIRNIGSIDQQSSDVLSPTDILLNAYNNPDGAVQAAPPLMIPVTQVNTVYPSSGGNVDGAPPSGGGTANIAVVTADATVIPVITPDSNPAVDTGSPAGGTPVTHSNTPWVLLALGVGAVYLATRKGKAVSGVKKKSLVIPAVIVGGVGLWWYMSKKNAAAAPSTTSTATTTPVITPPAPVESVSDQQRADLRQTYAGQLKQLATINTSSDDDIRIWHLIVEIWNGGHPADYPYQVDTNGNPLQLFGLSLGKWWENFSAKNGF